MYVYFKLFLKDILFRNFDATFIEQYDNSFLFTLISSQILNRIISC